MLQQQQAVVEQLVDRRVSRRRLRFHTWQTLLRWASMRRSAAPARGDAFPAPNNRAAAPTSDGRYGRSASAATASGAPEQRILPPILLRQRGRVPRSARTHDHRKHAARHTEHPAQEAIDESQADRRARRPQHPRDESRPRSARRSESSANAITWRTTGVTGRPRQHAPRQRPAYAIAATMPTTHAASAISSRTTPRDEREQRRQQRRSRSARSRSRSSDVFPSRGRARDHADAISPWRQCRCSRRP